jgi:hypothetical protein
MAKLGANCSAKLFEKSANRRGARVGGVGLHVTNGDDPNFVE